MAFATTRPPSLLQTGGRPVQQHRVMLQASRSFRAQHQTSAAAAAARSPPPPPPTPTPTPTRRDRRSRPPPPAALGSSSSSGVERRLRPPPAALGSSSSSGVERLPQNTDNPLALPDPSLSPLEAVAAQLDALSAAQLDAPWPLHGVGVAYAFCADSGSLSLSRYFAPMSTSLYHQDHFQGKFLTRFPGLVGHGGWRVEEEEPEDGEGVAAVRVSVAPSSSSSSSSSGGGEGGARHTYVFVMVKQEAGLRKGSWVTKQLVRLGEDGAVVVA